MKILFLREKNDIRMQLLKTKLEDIGHRVDIFDMVNYELIKDGKSIKILNKRKKSDIFLPFVLIKRLYSAYKIFKNLEGNYDVCHIFNIKRQNFWLIPRLKRKAKKIVIMVFGPSTFEYLSKRILFRNIYKYVDIITFSNPEFKDLFNRIYRNQFEEKTKIMMIPFKIFKEIDELSKIETPLESRQNLEIDNNRITVLCSTSGMSLENHFKVINAIKSLNNSKYLFIFMLTYGGTKIYLAKVTNYITKNLATNNYLIFKKFLPNIDIARLRQATDIMINVRKKDQITGHMLEALYSGSIVICGEWLPYRILDDWGVFYIKINTISQIPDKLIEITNNFGEYKQKANTNKTILENNLNGEKIFQEWLAIYKN